MGSGGACAGSSTTCGPPRAATSGSDAAEDAARPRSQRSRQSSETRLRALFSLVAFLGAGFSAIATFRFTTPPLSYISLFAGLLSLASLVLFIARVTGGVGLGGMERMIVHPRARVGARVRRISAGARSEVRERRQPSSTAVG
ncbi:MAG: hypothetical protein HY557_05255 [Euryarchaeota archaeon]|nr:hypothetical protein [Euryarchaeota archaeon]